MNKTTMNARKLKQLREWTEDSEDRLEAGRGMIAVARAVGGPQGDPPLRREPYAVGWARQLSGSDDAAAETRKAGWAQLQACFQSLESLLSDYTSPHRGHSAPPLRPAPWGPAAESLRELCMGLQHHFDLILELTDPDAPWMGPPVYAGRNARPPIDGPEQLLQRLASNAAAVVAALKALGRPAHEGWYEMDEDRLASAQAALASFLEHSSSTRTTRPSSRRRPGSRSVLDPGLRRDDKECVARSRFLL